MTSLLWRSAVPLGGLALIAVVVLVALAVLATDDSLGSSASLPVIQIGSPSAVQGGSGTTSTTAGSVPGSAGSDAGQVQGTGAALGATGNGGAGSAAVRPRGTTVVTAGIRVQPGPKYQGGATGTSGTHGSGSSGSPGK